VLRDQLVSQFHERDVDVVLDASKNRMTVKFMNSPLYSATREVKQHRADEVAAFVTSHYKHPLSSVSTQFVSKQGALSLAETFKGRPATQ
jgi:tRNA1(Val) A37 N6-methylase TrmN6